MTHGRTRPGMAMKTSVDLQVLDDLQALRCLEGTIDHLENIARRRESGIGAFALQKLFDQTGLRQARPPQAVSRESFGCP